MLLRTPMFKVDVTHLEVYQVVKKEIKQAVSEINEDESLDFSIPPFYISITLTPKQLL